MGAIVRILVVLTVGTAAVYGSMLALAYLVEPEERDVSVAVQPGKFNR